jgi:hypothetical protein
MAYNLSGYVSAQGAVGSAYLRVSWYPTLDGSGRAIATDDSTGRVTGANSDFAFLSTGPLAPPPGAYSARVRALLTPVSTSYAAMYVDDFSFTTAGPASAIAPKSGASDDDTDLPSEDEPAPRPKRTPTPTRTPRPPTATRTPVAETSSTSVREAPKDEREVAQVMGVRNEPTPRPLRPKEQPAVANDWGDVDTVPAQDVMLLADQRPAPVVNTGRLLLAAGLVSLLCGVAGAAGYLYVRERLVR